MIYRVFAKGYTRPLHIATLPAPTPADFIDSDDIVSYCGEKINWKKNITFLVKDVEEKLNNKHTHYCKKCAKKLMGG